MQEITISNNSELNPSNALTNEVKKTFNITPAVQRKFGSAKGLISMSPDFDEPLEDFKDYM
ncbi:MAG TPA: type II toxin-antitoxin system prevent-host-death family antitoxin [Planktothrix sp. UBA8407]|nr:type II toxin-antitoxin system prevent-host-death family antitoxin [Planktothrix sp. UBA8407]HBK24067.1 type II toxin-antitoxin system prevent-host-death family antitoxin [Planktothrix sp. UBA10369]